MGTTKHKIDAEGRECIGIDGIECEYKPWKEFSKDKQNRQGHQARCKACVGIYRQRPEYKRRRATLALRKAARNGYW